MECKKEIITYAALTLALITGGFTLNHKNTPDLVDINPTLMQSQTQSPYTIKGVQILTEKPAFQQSDQTTKFLTASANQKALTQIIRDTPSIDKIDSQAEPFDMKTYEKNLGDSNIEGEIELIIDQMASFRSLH